MKTKKVSVTNTKTFDLEYVENKDGQVKKIDPSKWTLEDYKERENDFVAQTIHHGLGTSRMNGRSTEFVSCGFCETQHEVYTWSFAGSGKRCENCGALMGPQGTSAEKDRIKQIGSLLEKDGKMKPICKTDNESDF